MPFWSPRQEESRGEERRRYLPRVTAITFEQCDGSCLIVVEETARAIDCRERADGDEDDRGCIISNVSSAPLSSERVNEKSGGELRGYNLPQDSENGRL